MVVTAGASSINIDNAVLNGSVNPDGLATTAWFEWGTSPTLTTWDNTSVKSVGSGTTNIPINETITGLNSGTAYYYRMVEANSAGTVKGLIVSLTTASPFDSPIVQTFAADNLSVSGAILQANVIPNGLPTNVHFEWGQDNTFSIKNVTQDQSIVPDNTSHLIVANLVSLTAGTKYFYRVVASNSRGTSTGETASFTTNPPSPSGTTNPAASVGPIVATLNGSVTPNGLATAAWFEYGTDPTLTTSSSTTSQFLGSGTANVPVSAVLTGLSAATTYYFRVEASNSAGTTRGSILNFTTGAATTVTTLPVSSLGAIDATLNGSVTPNGLATNAWFEYGTDPTLTTSTSTASQSLGSGTANVPVNATLSGLSAATTYYFRVAGSNSAGTTRGSILSFTTNWPTFYSDFGFTGTQAPDTGFFSVDFCPTTKYSPGGQFVLRLQDDFNTYFEVSNYDWDNPIDPHPKASARKVRNRVTVDNVVFTNSYSQGNCYTVKITFSPAFTTVEAFGETIHLTANDAGFPVWSFMVETTNQDASLANITPPVPF